MTQVEVGELVTFKGDPQTYTVTFVGPKYFHVALPDGRESGPYTTELLEP